MCDNVDNLIVILRVHNSCSCFAFLSWRLFKKLFFNMNKMLRFDFLQMGACEVVCYVFLSLVFAAASLRFPHLNPFLKLTPCQLKHLLRLEKYTSGKEIYCYLVTVQSFYIMFIFLLFLITYNICCVFVYPHLVQKQSVISPHMWTEHSLPFLYCCLGA